MKPAARIAVWTAPLMLAACTVQTLHLDDALTLVPYELVGGGRIVVDVMVDGRGPFPFALDTAASISFVFEDLRRALELDVVPGASATVRGAVASGSFPVVGIDRIQVGGEVWHNAELVVLPGATEATAAIAGILGIDFLKRYGLGFSAEDRVVRLYPPELAGARSYRGWAFVPLAPVNVGQSSEPLYFLDIEVGGATVPALFDLGAGLNLMNVPAARDLRLAPRRAARGDSLVGALEQAPILAQLSEPVATSGVRWRNEAFLIADAEIFATLGYTDRALAIVGAGMFNQRDFVIDFARNRLIVRTAMAEIEGRVESTDAAPAESGR